MSNTIGSSFKLGGYVYVGNNFTQAEVQIINFHTKFIFLFRKMNSEEGTQKRFSNQTVKEYII